MSSWYDALADRYGDWSSTSVAPDVSFYVGLARDADGPLVELAVGTGRVAIPVAQATGRRVLGIDSSPAMLAQARMMLAKTRLAPVQPPRSRDNSGALARPRLF